MSKLIPINDNYMRSLKSSWFNESHAHVRTTEFIPIADEWFKSTKLNTLHGWDEFDCCDVVLGCTHFFESLILKHGWDNIQVLEREYAYYTLMGKHGSKLGELKPNSQLIVSLPNWFYADIRPEWEDVLRECEQKNIDIHIDFAWITVARGIELDLSHPCIKSFAMSLSKLSLEWNRIGLRWSRQRTMDSVTIYNRFHVDVNSALTSCGAFMMENIPRDYCWDTYGEKHFAVCKQNNLVPTKLIHVAKTADLESVVGVGDLITLL